MRLFGTRFELEDFTARVTVTKWTGGWIRVSLTLPWGRLSLWRGGRRIFGMSLGKRWPHISWWGINDSKTRCRL